MVRSKRRSLLRAVLAALVIQSFAFSTVVVVVAQDTRANFQIKKKSKKRKKKRAAGLWIPSLRTVQTSPPLTSLPIADTPAALPARRTARAAMIPRVRLLPIKGDGVQDIAPAVFSNGGSIEISAVNAGADPEPVIPYSSDVEVLGLTGVVTGISVTLNGLTHASPDDLDMLLVGPGGQTFHFWSDVGGTNTVENISVTIADSGITHLPDSDVIVDGTTYRPFNADLVGDTFPVPAVGGPYNEPENAGAATFASVFNGLNANQVNGTWSLFITDDADGNGGSIAQGWSLNISTEIPATTSGQLVISEFRLSGPSGADDEFIEVYNTTGAPLTVHSAGLSTGLGVAASDGITRCVIPNGTVIPAAGHYLCAHASNSLPIAPDLTYAAGINENAGLAIFNNAEGGSSYTLANRIDAAGAATETDSIYKEGTGYPAITGAGLNYSFFRDLRPNGEPKDTNDNGVDFLFVETNAANAGAGQRLGAPGAENLFSPVQQNVNVLATLIAPCTGASNSPNRVRNLNSDPENHSTFGTLSIRRLITNTTANDITQLRFRIIDVTTFPAPEGAADLRALSSSDSTEVDPCNLGGLVDLVGLTLEGEQPMGGGFNSTLTLPTSLPSGSSINVNFLLGVQQTGHFRFFINIEALP